MLYTVSGRYRLREVDKDENGVVLPVGISAAKYLRFQSEETNVYAAYA